jgi:hypothetical protein
MRRKLGWPWWLMSRSCALRHEAGRAPAHTANFVARQQPTSMTTGRPSATPPSSRRK